MIQLTSVFCLTSSLYTWQAALEEKRRKYDSVNVTVFCLMWVCKLGSVVRFQVQVVMHTLVCHLWLYEPLHVIHFYSYTRLCHFTKEAVYYIFLDFQFHSFDWEDVEVVLKDAIESCVCISSKADVRQNINHLKRKWLCVCHVTWLKFSLSCFRHTHKHTHFQYKHTQRKLFWIF